MPLLIVTTMSIQWGVVTSYLAQVAEPAGANVAVFFTMDAVSVFLTRIPVGWLVDRVPPRPFVLLGTAGLATCVALTPLPPSTAIYFVAGSFAGGGGGIVIAPLLLVMAHRSSDRDRGSAFAFFYVAMALGAAIGSVAGAPLFTIDGFGLAMAALGITGSAASAVLTLLDRGLGTRSSLASGPTGTGADSTLPATAAIPVVGD